MSLIIYKKHYCRMKNVQAKTTFKNISSKINYVLVQSLQWSQVNNNFLRKNKVSHWLRKSVFLLAGIVSWQKKRFPIGWDIFPTEKSLSYWLRTFSRPKKLFPIGWYNFCPRPRFTIVMLAIVCMAVASTLLSLESSHPT